MGKISDLTPEGKEELVVSLATLICADAKVDVTEDNLKKLVSGSNNKVAAYWTQMFAKLSAGHDLLKAIGGAPGVAVASAAGAAAGGAAPAEEKKEEKEEEEEETGNVGGLFGDDDDW